jgi:hypothetical protein
VSDTAEPAVPLLARTIAIGELLEQAAKEMPELEQDGLQVSVHLDERGASVAGTVQIHNFKSRLVASRTWTGQKQLDATVTWTF